MKKILLISLLALMSVPVWGMDVGEPETGEEKIRRLRGRIAQNEEDIKELEKNPVKDSYGYVDVTLVEYLRGQRRAAEKSLKRIEEEIKRDADVQELEKNQQWGKYIAGGAAVLGTLGVLAWGGLTLWQKRAIASVLSQYKLKPEDLTQQQRNLLAATFNARYNPWALRAYAGKFDESAPIFDFPHAWQILQQLYFVRKATRAKIAAFRNYMLRKP